MNEGREHSVIKAFVDLSNELVDDYDVVEMLTRLTASCAELLDVESAGMLLADGHGILHLAASSSARVSDLEAFQLQREEGPCLDAYRSGEMVIAVDPDSISRGWPQFAGATARAGFASVHAFPMRLREHRLGTLGLFGTSVGRLGDDDLALAQALVHVASVAIVNEQLASDQATVNAQLQKALTSRVVLEQAKGVLAAGGDLSMEDAFTVLRRYSRDHGRKISAIAAQVVGRELGLDVLLDHARQVAILPR